MTNFNERLKEERKRLGLNQTDFAALANVGQIAQVNYENGKRNPDSKYLQAIANAGADVQYILTGTRSQQIQATPPTNYVNLNKKKIEKVMEDLTAEQQAEVIKVAEEKQRMNWYEIELSTLKKQVG
jgi:transcriptional regulator with XRE-family HTH domain